MSQQQAVPTQTGYSRCTFAMGDIRPDGNYQHDDFHCIDAPFQLCAGGFVRVEEWSGDGLTCKARAKQAVTLRGW